MASFIYKAIDSQTGQKVSVTIAATDQAQADRAVIERGLHPLSVKEEKKGLLAGLAGRGRSGAYLVGQRPLVEAGLWCTIGPKMTCPKNVRKELLA